MRAASRRRTTPSPPVIVRGQVVEWLEGDAAWEVIDRIATKYTGQPYPRGQERAVALIEPSVQRVGIGQTGGQPLARR